MVLDREGQALELTEAPGAHRAGAFGGLPGLPSKARGRTPIPDKRHRYSRRPDSRRGRGRRRRRAPARRPCRSRARRAGAPDPAGPHRGRARAAGRSLRDRLRARRRGRRDGRPRPLVQAFVFACEHHADQRRRSGEDFIVHPVGVAKICAGMRLDTETLCAALLHDTVEDTSASLEEVREAFGDEVAGLVDGVTKLTGITFQSRDEAQAENYRKMMVAMATDIRVILIKLADRLHNMRTLDAMRQAEADREGQGDAGDLRAAGAPARHPRDQVGARGPRLRDAASPQVHGDQGPGQPAARGARALRGARRRLPGQGARGARHPRRDLRARQALLLDLLEDDPQGPRVQRDLRPDGDARDRRLREGLLRGGRRHPLAVEAAARALQGHDRHAQVQHVPGAPHDRDRARGPATGDPDPHRRHARDRRVRRRRALALQGGRRRAPGRAGSIPATSSSSGSSRCSTGRATRTTRASSPSSCATS